MKIANHNGLRFLARHAPHRDEGISKARALDRVAERNWHAWMHSCVIPAEAGIQRKIH
jgi:hypothetical protein